jgi:hypothetical protein
LRQRDEIDGFGVQDAVAIGKVMHAACLEHDPESGNRFSVAAVLERRYWSSGSRINDFFWLAAGGGDGATGAGAPDASAAEAAGGGGTAALGGGSSGPLRPQADRPSAMAVTSTADANLTLKRSKAKRRSPPASATA